MKDNVLIVHGGGPTTVINASLYGAIEEAKKYSNIGAVYGALGGTDGLLNENFIDLKQVPQKKLDLLPHTPASALGTSRTKLYPEDYEKIVEILKKNNIKHLLFNGGNGSMDTCGKIYKLAKDYGINIIGIPKTIDNDIAVTDHCPGFGSAARYVANSVAEAAQDIKAMPIHVSVIETMGRNAGWISASSILARKKPGDAPHLVYVPEVTFNEKEFLEDTKRLYEELGGVVVVCSEGLLNDKGQSIVDPIFTRGRDVYFGDVSAYLALLVIKELGIKARSEKPGLMNRASVVYQSRVDREEAIEAGAYSLKAALEGNTGFMVGFKRLSNEPYKSETILIPLEEVMMHEKKLPLEYISKRTNDINPSFIEYCKPLIGDPLPEYCEFR